MKTKFLLAAFTLLVLFTGCFKDPEDPCKTYDACSFRAPESEIQQVRNYIQSAGISDTVQHCSGVYYVIQNAGTGKSPTPCSFIGATYTGRLTNGTIFDQGSFNQLIKLTSLVRGWTNTLPLIKQGGSIRLFIPPSLGYGNQQFGSIPPNSVLIFDVQLTQVQD
jgi:FKBP-type peptidyl-prolyl cis-trans isomerase FkpA